MLEDFHQPHASSSTLGYHRHALLYAWVPATRHVCAAVSQAFYTYLLLLTCFPSAHISMSVRSFASAAATCCVTAETRVASLAARSGRHVGDLHRHTGWLIWHA